MIKVLDWVKSFWAAEAPVEFRALASGPTPEGALSISLSPGYTYDHPKYFITDLGFRGLSMLPGMSYDLGSLYTQKQINDSHELKIGLTSGIILAAAIGTVPSLEKVNLTGVPTATAISIIDQTTSDPMTVNPDGSINVNTTSLGDTEIEYGTASGIASGIETTVASYTVGAGQQFYLKHVSASGTNVSTFKIRVNGSVIGVRRSSFTDYNVDFAFETDTQDGLLLVATDTVDVRAVHIRPVAIGTSDFNATIIGRLE